MTTDIFCCYVVFMSSFTIDHRLLVRVTRRVPLVEQELLTFPEHLSLPPVFCGVRVTRSLIFSVEFCRSFFVILSFFLLTIVLFFRLRFTASAYPCDIFKRFHFD
jgi:hypothetical protein